ncbi:hypothetical protein [Gemmata sp.]|uniref:hypothetical protein n=1 Tax=Gemmata sp. TaxID=1914242 RepID=UPI003F72A9F3
MEDVLKLYREELARVQAERDQANDERRKLWAAVGCLKSATGTLLGCVEAAHECAENDEFLRSGTFDSVRTAARHEIDVANKLLGIEAAE